MSDTPARPGALAAKLQELVHAYLTSRVIYAAAKLKLPDLIARGADTPEALAKESQSHPEAVHRLLRCLAAVELVQTAPGGKFRLTELGQLLRSDQAGSVWSMAIMAGEEPYEAWGEIVHSIQTNQAAFDKRFGVSIWDYFKTHPEAGSTFSRAMRDRDPGRHQAILRAYDFSTAKTVADVGGGTGALLRTLLQRHPHLRGILADLPYTQADAEALVREAGLSDRLQVQPHNFFESVPTGADLYILSGIISDWDDARALEILGQVRKSLPPGGKLLVLELLIPEGDRYDWSKFADLHMLVLVGSSHRTEAQYRSLFQRAGFRLNRVLPTEVDIFVLELVAA